MNADDINGQLGTLTTALDAAIQFINALWTAYDNKPTTMTGIDPAAIQPAIDGLAAKFDELSQVINSRPVP